MGSQVTQLARQNVNLRVAFVPHRLELVSLLAHVTYSGRGATYEVSTATIRLGGESGGNSEVYRPCYRQGGRGGR